MQMKYLLKALNVVIKKFNVQYSAPVGVFQNLNYSTITTFSRSESQHIGTLSEL
jgi:hypothetical protein